MANSSLVDCLYEALRSPHGIRVWSDDPERLTEFLRRARSIAMDPNLECLSFTITSVDEMAIFKRLGS